MPSWDDYRKQYIEDEKKQAERWTGRIEDLFESPIERIAFMYLVLMSNQVFHDYEVHISAQHRIGQYRVDFLVDHKDTNTYIVVECDGHEFHEKTKEQADRDKRRDRFMTKQGYIVLRYTGKQICDNPMEIYEDVAEIIIDRKKVMREVAKNGPKTND